MRSRFLDRPSAPLLPLIGLMLLVLLALGWTVRAGAARLDEVRRASEARLVGHAVKALRQTIARQAHDYTYWDDAVRYLTLAPAPDWIDANITVLLSRWGYDYILVLGADGQTRYAYVDGKRAAGVAARTLLGPGHARGVARRPPPSGPGARRHPGRKRGRGRGAGAGDGHRRQRHRARRGR